MFKLIVGMIFVISALGPNDPSQQIIARRGYRDIPHISRPVALGGLLVPGHEALGTVFSEEVLALLGSPSVSVEPIAIQATDLGIPSADTLNISTSQVITNQCVDAHIFLTKLTANTLVLKPGQAETLRQNFATKLKILPEDLNTYVIVTSTLDPQYEIRGCGKTTTLYSSHSLAYKAGVPLNSVLAAGNGRSLSVLELFELNRRAINRTIHVHAVTTAPTGLEVSWIDRVRLAGRDVNKLQPGDFEALGISPTGVLDLWVGRFYFRIRDGHKVDIRQVDLELTSNNNSVSLDVTK